MFLRFPDERFTVFVAANAGDMDTRSIGYRITRIFLRDKMKDSLEEPRAFIRAEESSLRMRAGDYLSTKSADLLSVRPCGDRLICTWNDDLKVEYAPVSADEFRPFTPGYPVVLKFGSPGPDGRIGVSTFQSGKLLQTYQPIVRAVPAAADLKEIEGAYYSEELKTTYRFEVEAGWLYVRFKRAPKSDLKPLRKDQFAAWPLMFDFERDAKGRIQGFRLGKIGPQGIPFVLVKEGGSL
jgi:hypothetical protein